MPTTNQTPLEFSIGEESAPVIEDITRYDRSIFKPVYDKVFSAIYDFINREIIDEKQCDVNNIFAFSGERGTGKSSCMQSVALMLEKSPKELLSRIDSQRLAVDREKEQWGPFLNMDTVDPGFFEQNNNLLQLVVGRMFRTFKMRVDNENASAISQNDKHMLVVTFEKVYQNIRTLFRENEVSNESLDALLSLSASYDLRDNFRELVDLYLKFISSKQQPAKYLVIPIDDIDLLTKYAYGMVEQIRKYMMHSNVIILMAVRIGQLEDVVAKQYVEEFSSMLDQKLMNKGETIEMSERYIAKLIPQQRRFFLTLMETNFEAQLDIINADRSRESFPTVREAVLDLIFTKTRFLFYNSKGVTSYIVPRNLRELRSLIRMLHDMPDYRIYDKERTIKAENKYNKELFQHYFMESWLKNNLDDEESAIIRDVWGAEVILKNKLIIESLKAKCESVIDNSVLDQELSPIIKASNKAYDISTGDVLGTLDLLEKYDVSIGTQKLIFAIRTIYSMFLYRYYDEMQAEDKAQVSMSSNLKQDGTKEILKHELLEFESSYIKLVAGNYFNSPLYDMLPKERSGRSRTHLTINARPIIMALEEIALNPDSLNTETQIAKLNLLEFFLLNIVERADTKKADARSIGNPSYLYNVTKYTTKFVFDICGFMFNLVEIDRTYDRYSEWFGGEKIVKRIKENKHSLYQKIASYAKDQGDHKSMVCYRNAEILNSLGVYIISNRQKGEGNNLVLYQTFYKRVSEFKIDTYDKYSILFNYVSVFSKVLSAVSGNNELSIIFESVFSSSRTLNISIKLNAESNNKSTTILHKLEVLNPGLDFQTEFNTLFKKDIYKKSEARDLLIKLMNRLSEKEIEKELNGQS